MIEAAIALRYPADLGDANDLSAAIAATAMDYCVFTKEGDATVRFPLIRLVERRGGRPGRSCPAGVGAAERG